MQKLLRRRELAVMCGVLPLLLSTGVHAQDAVTLDKVEVTAERISRLALDGKTETGSRLALSARETPAAVDVLTQEDLQARGVRGTVEAFNAAAGVTAANLPSSPGVTSMRGFTGGAISLLFDGIRQTAGPLFTRDFDVWSFDRIEILKGPASVLYGEGALAGAINLVPKRPQFDAVRFAGLLSAGSFDSARVGLDINVPVGETLAVRAIVSGSRSGGHVDDTSSTASSATIAGSWRPSEQVRLDVAIDHVEDDYDTSYWGTPLVPASIARAPTSLVRTPNGLVIDQALRNRNYNVEDGAQTSESDWLRTRLAVQLAAGWSFNNELSYYDAQRRWLNSETYTYSAATGLLNRGTTWIEHDHQYWVERAAFSHDGDVSGRRNRFTAGVEFSENDFLNPRRFGVTSAVNPYTPVRGRFPVDDTSANFPGAGNRVDFDSTTRVASVFVEDALNVTPRWLLLGGVRYDRIELERQAEDFNTATLTRFDRVYEPLSWRVGTVFDLQPKTQLYAQYNEGSAPVGSMLLISLANSRFDLTAGRAVDAGIKTTLLDDSVDLTLGGYWIEQDDIITRNPVNFSQSIQGGRQSSRGIEATMAARVGNALRIDASVAALDARFDELIEAGGVDRSGNTPPNVPELVANLFASYRFDAMPVTLSTGVRHAGRFFTNNANTIRVAKHTVLDAAVAYRLPFGEVTLRGRNLTDELYADWAGGAADQVVLGAPRSVELGLTVKF